MKKKINSNLFSSILYLIIGVLLIAFPGDMISWAMTGCIIWWMLRLADLGFMELI